MRAGKTRDFVELTLVVCCNVLLLYFERSSSIYVSYWSSTMLLTTPEVLMGGIRVTVTSLVEGGTLFTLF